MPLTIAGFLRSCCAGMPVLAAFHHRRNHSVACLALLISLAGVIQDGRSASAVGCAQPSFRSAHVFKVGASPRSIATGDFNGDSRPDFVTANYDADSVSVYVSNGTNDFAGVGNFSIGAHPRSVATGDFDGDLKTDILTANDTAMEVAILFGNGAGGFSGPSRLNLGVIAQYAVVADFNGDTRADVAVATNSFDGIRILLGNGAGGFGTATRVSGSAVADFIAVGDFDNDGDRDLALNNHPSADASQILLNNGTGNFTSAAFSCANTRLSSMAVGDMNGDGKLDLVGTKLSANTVSILRATGTGCFEAPTNFDISPGPGLAHAPFAVAVADFNSDGKLDVATANGGSNNVTLFLGDGVGGLGSPNVYGGAFFPRSLAVADYDSDGRPDLAVAHSEGSKVSLMFGSAAAGFRYASGRGSSAMATADFNGDGRLDLAIHALGVSILLGKGAGDFEPPRKFPAGTAVEVPSLALGDFNSDGKVDVIVPSRNQTFTDAIAILLGDGAGNLGVPSFFSVSGLTPNFVAVGDFNGDGRLDALTANRSTRDLSILLGDGNGSFGTSTSVPVEATTNLRGIAVADLNGDGKVDLAVPSSGGGVSVLLNNGSGGFPTETKFPTGGAVAAIARDFNGDSKLDLGVANFSSLGLSILLGNGAGGFSPPTNLPTGGFAQHIVSADFNIDGILDVATINLVHREDNVSVLLGDGSGGFGLATNYLVGINPWMIAAGDFSDDGRPEVITSNSSSSDISVLLNTCTSGPPPAQGTIQFSALNYDVQEGGGRVTVTVTRLGNAIGAASVDYDTSDGTASERSDYMAALGTLRMADGESSKSFSVFIVDDAFAVEGNESFNVRLSNVMGAIPGTPHSATVTIINNDPTVTPINPIDEAQFFVRQHYLDFLNREPDAAGLAFWTNQITSCGSDGPCIEIRRINVSAAFFLSIEFQETGYLVYRMYKVAYGDTTSPNVTIPVPIIRQTEFLRDAQRIGQGVQVGIGDWQTQLENNKNTYAREFVVRQRFLNDYPLTMTPTQFVDKLNLEAGGVLSQVERDQLIAELTAATDVTAGRASVVRKVAEDGDLRQRESNRAFVLMQYYGYLRRNPDDPQDTDFGGWEFWLNKLNQHNGNFVTAEMVKSFIVSSEYRQRFGP